MTGSLADLRLAARTLRRTPASAIAAVCALGLGIGLSALVFSIVQTTLLGGLPTPEPHEIVRITRVEATNGFFRPVTVQDYEAWAAATASLDEIGAYMTVDLNLSGSGTDVPERIDGVSLTPSVLRLLEVRPALGRSFDEADAEPGAPAVMLIGAELWQRRFGGDPDVVGRVVRVDGVETVIAGVLPDGFGFPQSEDVWLPLRTNAARTSWGSGSVQVVARLRDGVTPQSALPELTAIAARMAELHPDTHENSTVRVATFAGASGEERTLLAVMVAAVAGVLLIACLNVTNLLLGRAIARAKEVGIRMALGASRQRVAMPFLAESAVLAAAGAVTGLAVAFIGLRLFVREIESSNPPYWFDFSLNGGALAYIAGAAIVSALLAGLLPALQAARATPNDTLKDVSRGTSSFRMGRVSRGLVIAEFALSLALLVGAGLLIRSVKRLNDIDVGVPAGAVFVARVSLPESSYDADARNRFATELGERLAAVPGAVASSLSDNLPGRFGSNTWIEVEGRVDGDGARPYANIPIVSPGYFEVFDALPLRGRGFTAADDATAPLVALVSRSFEARYLDGNGLGRRVRIGGEDSPWLTIVGVVPDMLQSGIENIRPESIYRPLAQHPARYLSIALRGAGSPLELVAPVRSIVRELDPDLPLYDAGTLQSLLARENFVYGLLGKLFGAFGAAALLLATVGLYGVMAFSVAQRGREVGLRMAVGATSGDVLRLIVGQGMRQVAIGAAIGAPIALGIGQVLSFTLYGVGARDPVTFGGVALLLTAVALAASLVPALRATRVDPLEALRAE